jgi:hypothetical protein
MAVLFCVAAMASHEKPSFTGVWKHGESGRTASYEIEHQDPNLRITFKSEFSVGSLVGGVSAAESYTTDGVERANKTSNGWESWTSVNWRGPSLVIFRVVKDGYRVNGDSRDMDPFTGRRYSNEAQADNQHGRRNRDYASLPEAVGRTAWNYRRRAANSCVGVEIGNCG